MFLAGFVFRVLGVVQVEGADFSYHKSFYAGSVALLGDEVGFLGDVELLCLVVEVLDQQEDVLVEVHLFLAYFGWLLGAQNALSGKGI